MSTVNQLGKYQPYPDYKDSGVEWLSNVPRAWEVQALKYLVSCNDEVLSETTDPEFEFEYIDIGGVSSSDGVTKTENLKFSASPSRARRIVRTGDIIVSTVRTYLEAIAPISIEFDGKIVSTGFAVLRPKFLLSEFAKYSLRARYFIDSVVARSTGVSYPAINASELTNIKIALPGWSEQKTIAAFLDYETARIDQLIAKQQQLIELLKEKRQAVISHAVTKGLNPNAPMKDSGVEWLGQVPEHWTIPKLCLVTSKIGDGLHGTPIYEDGTGFYFVNGNNLDNGVISFRTTAKEVPHDEFQRHAVPLDNTSVLMSINGTIGNLALYRDEPVILGKSAAYINCLPKMDRRYVLFYLRGDSVNRYFDLELTGTTISNLSLNSIRQMKICVPPLDEQEQIVEYCERKLSKFKMLIDSAFKIVDLMQERRTALISAAVTGKIDLRGWQPPKSEVAA